MALTKKLQTQIEKFLNNPKKSEGGWAPVDDGEIEALSEIVYALIEAKYERDPDGDLPVSAHLTDRTRFKLPVILPIPHIRDDGKIPDVSASLEAINRHMAMASANSESANILMRLLSGEVRQCAETERPLKLGGKTYRAVAVPKENILLDAQWLEKYALKLFTKEEAKNPCPSDWSQRTAWAERLVRLLQAAWGFAVALESCRLTSKGVSVGLSIPALDKVIRFNVGEKTDAS